MDATLTVALSLTQKANKATDLKGFVEQTKMNLQLQMVALAAQLDLVKEMNGMTNTQDKKIDLLYFLLVKVVHHHTPSKNNNNSDDDDDDGTMIDAIQLADSLKEASKSLAFVDKIHQAVDDAVKNSTS